MDHIGDINELVATLAKTKTPSAAARICGAIVAHLLVADDKGGPTFRLHSLADKFADAILAELERLHDGE